MTNIYKEFYNDDLLSTATALFTAAGEVFIKDVSLVVHGGSTETVELFIGSALDQRLWRKVELLDGEGGEFSGTKIVPSGSAFFGRTSNPTSVSITISGMEKT